jgi:hypothetical protein
VGLSRAGRAQGGAWLGRKDLESGGSPPKADVRRVSAHPRTLGSSFLWCQDEGGGGTRPGVLPNPEGGSRGEVWSCQGTSEACGVEHRAREQARKFTASPLQGLLSF